MLGRLLATFLACALLITACGSSTPSSSAPTHGPSETRGPSATPQPPATFSEADVQRAVADLAAIGVDVRARPADAAPLVATVGERSAVHLLRLQVRAMAMERVIGSGSLGVRLDQVIASGGGGPLGALIAGWAKEGGTPAAKYAASLLRTPPDGNADGTVFPRLALVAFLADLTRGAAGTSRRGGNVLAVSSFCGDLSAYVGDALNGIFSVSGSIPAWLQNLVTAYAPQYANDPDLFQHTIGALGLLVYATTLAKPWTLQLQADPGATRYTVEGVNAEPVSGEVDLTVLVDPGYADEVADCADLADVKLPGVKPEGADVTWLPAMGSHATPTTVTSKVDSGGQASLNYETTTECKEASQGSEVTDVMTVAALVDRQEIRDLRDAAEKILLGDAYGSPLGEPVATEYQAMKSQLHLSSMPSGFVNIDIVHHDGPCASSSPDATPGTPGTDCATMLPADEVESAVGVSIGTPTVAGDASVFPIACVWEDVVWSLQGNGPIDPPVARFLGQLAGIPCDVSGGDSSLIYCLSEDQGVVGGFVYTSRWGFILSTKDLSLDQVVKGILPILDRHGN